MAPAYFNDPDPWMLGEDIPNADLFFATIWLNGFVSNFDKNTGRIYKKILCKFDGYHLWFYFGEKNSYEVAEHIAERMINESGYMAEVNRNIVIQADKLSQFSGTIPQAGLEALSGNELWRIYKTHQEIHSEYYTWAWIPVGVDMFHNNLTKRVKEYVAGMGVSEERINEYFITLTQPTEKSLIFIEQEELLQIAEKMRDNPDDPRHHELIEAHRQKYYYTKHL